MDWYTSSWPRRFRSRFTVVRVGRFARKTGWVNNRFDTVNFSFILSGSGEYRLNGTVHRVVAPCVITEWPEQHFNYGPFEVWDELFICFASSCMAALVERGLLDTARPVWYLRDPGPVRAQLDRLTGLLGAAGERCVGDRLDLMAEGAVMESLIRTAEPALSPEQQLVQNAALAMNQELAAPFDFEEFARRNRIHSAALRRAWTKTFRQPPLQYHMQLRMQHACTLLAETSLPVKAVGAESGFADQLYFSRYFRRRLGCSPLAYRERTRGP